MGTVDDRADHLLSVAEASRIAKVSHGTVKEWVESNLLDVVLLPNRRYPRIRRRTLLAFLDSCEKKHADLDTS